MNVLLNTDSNIEGHEALARQVETIVEGALHRFADEITRVEVHLTDSNSHKDGQADKRCVLEARLAGHQPLVASDQAATLEQAVTGAARKLKTSLETVLGRIGRR